jgi:hypothetical protein
MSMVDTGSTAGPDGPPATAERAVAANGRSADGRLARLHLRTGALGLARAELESLAGAGELDDPALLDLAEVRWRTGDLPGAGEAATAYLESTSDDGSRDPRDELVALVVAAEATAESGRPAEARRLAARALERAEGSLDALFAGMPRGTIWPHDPTNLGEPASVPPGEVHEAPPAWHSGEPMRARSETAPSVPTLWSPEPTPGAGPEPQLDHAAQLEAARRALEAGHADVAATRLAIVLRLSPAIAPAVIEVLDQAVAESPMLAIVAGDAFRLAGREADAQRSYARAVSGLASDGDQSDSGVGADADVEAIGPPEGQPPSDPQELQ